MANPATSGRELLEGLLALEINTISKPAMTGRKMPPPAVALYDIRRTYSTFLGPNIAPAPQGTEAQIVVDFRRIAAAAGNSTAIGNPTIEDIIGGVALDRPTVQVAAICRRVEHGSALILAILARPKIKAALKDYDGSYPPPPLSLSPTDLVEIRKVWELGVETVVLQTVVQADGDVVTRIGRLPDGRQVDPQLHGFHEAMVGVSVSNWQFLVQSVGQLIRALGGFFFSDRRG